MANATRPPGGGDEGREALVADGLDRIAEPQGFLGLSRASIYSLMDQGQLPYVKIGRARRIPRRALIQFAAQNVVARTARDGVA
jgi:excisionase family DNA binding protein